MSQQPNAAQHASCSLLESNNPQIHALVLQEEFEMFELGLSTLYILAPDGAEEPADQYAVNFVVKSLERSAFEMRAHFKALRRSLGMPEVQP